MRHSTRKILFDRPEFEVGDVILVCSCPWKNAAEGSQGTVVEWGWDIGLRKYVYKVDFDGRFAAAWYLERDLVPGVRG